MPTATQAQDIVEQLVARATAAGADAADAIYVASRSTSVEVRLRELEEVSRSEDEEVGLRLFLGTRSATVSSSELSQASLEALVSRGLAMAAEAPEDPYAGLAPSELLAAGPYPDLD